MWIRATGPRSKSAGRACFGVCCWGRLARSADLALQLDLDLHLLATAIDGQGDRVAGDVGADRDDQAGAVGDGPPIECGDDVVRFQTGLLGGLALHDLGALGPPPLLFALTPGTDAGVLRLAVLERSEERRVGK